MTAPTIGFDAIHHTYTVNGRVAPSVTGVIRSAGLMPSYEVADPSFGERVHDLTAEYDRDHPFEAPAIDMVILDETGDRLSQCLSQWIAFRQPVRRVAMERAGFQVDSPVKMPPASKTPRCAPPYTNRPGEEPWEGGDAFGPEPTLETVAA